MINDWWQLQSCWNIASGREVKIEGEEWKEMDTARFFGGLSGAIVRNMVLALSVDVEPAVLALEALLEEAF